MRTLKVGALSGLMVAAAMLLSATSEAIGVREKRFSQRSCYMNPDNNEDTVMEEGDTVRLDCNFDSNVETCIWTHNEPMNDGRGSSSDWDIKCSGSASTDGESCDMDTRVKYSFQGTKCGIEVSNSEPEDTGKWRLNAIGLANSGSGTQVNQSEM